MEDLSSGNNHNVGLESVLLHTSFASCILHHSRTSLIETKTPCVLKKTVPPGSAPRSTTAVTLRSLSTLHLVFVPIGVR